MSWYKPADVGFATRRMLGDTGAAARLFMRLLALAGPAFRRFGLVRDQIHFLGNYSLTEEEFSKLKKQADHGYMMDVENRRLKEELSTAKKEAVRWSNKYHDLWYDVKPYLDALHRAPELVRGFLEKILAPKQERTMNVPQRNRKRGQDMEL